MIAAAIVGGISAQASGVLNTPSGGYLVCINSKTKVVTHPGTAKCPKGSVILILGAQGIAGPQGLVGATGLNGKDGRDGKDGKTLWNGVTDPENAWGSPGDMFINSVTKTLFGPKDLITGWPIGVSMVGPKGDQGPIGPTGAIGPQGPGGIGPAGPTGATGPQGPSGIKITELYICGPDGISICKVGEHGPGDGLIFFVDYQDLYQGFNYLEVASTECAGQRSWASSNFHNTPIMAVNGWSARAVGSGLANTNSIVSADSSLGTISNNAAIFARSCVAGGKSDWFLGSLGEMKLVYANLQGLGGFTDSYHWSSSEAEQDYALAQAFGSGSQSYLAKNLTSIFVRPVRRF